MKKFISSSLAVLSIVSSSNLFTNQLYAAQKDIVVPKNRTITKCCLKVAKDILSAIVPAFVAASIYKKFIKNSKPIAEFNSDEIEKAPKDCEELQQEDDERDRREAEAQRRAFEEEQKRRQEAEAQKRLFEEERKKQLEKIEKTYKEKQRIQQEEQEKLKLEKLRRKEQERLQREEQERRHLEVKENPSMKNIFKGYNVPVLTVKKEDIIDLSKADSDDSCQELCVEYAKSMKKLYEKQSKESHYSLKNLNDIIYLNIRALCKDCPICIIEYENKYYVPLGHGVIFFDSTKVSWKGNKRSTILNSEATESNQVFENIRICVSHPHPGDLYDNGIISFLRVEEFQPSFNSNFKQFVDYLATKLKQ